MQLNLRHLFFKSQSILGATMGSLGEFHEVLGLVAATVLAHGSLIKAIAMIILGLLFGLVGGVIADFLGVGETRGIDWIRHGIQIGLAILFVWVFTRLATRDAARRRIER